MVEVREVRVFYCDGGMVYHHLLLVDFRGLKFIINFTFMGFVISGRKV